MISHTYAEPGTYYVSIYGYGIIFGSSAGKQITVVDTTTNTAPVVTFDCFRQEGFSVECATTGTLDAEGDELTYEIQWGDGTSEVFEDEVITHTYSTEGLYDILVSVSDGVNTTKDEVSLELVSGTENSPPQACFLVTQNPILPPPLNAMFDASCSSDADNDSLSYQWDFGDGTTASGAQTSHTYPAAGVYTTTLTVSDGAAEHSKTHTGTYGATETDGEATCEYLVTTEWGSGFIGVIRITNNGVAPLDSWNVNWQYSGNNRITSTWNATLSGSNPYAASNVGWNKKIQPNQTVEFGFQGSKQSGAAEIPVVSGDICQ